MSFRTPFKPHYGSNQIVTPAAASANVTITAADKSVRIVNTGANIAYFRIGEGAQTATTADVAIPAAASIIVQKGITDNNIAHISAAGTTLQIMTGEGGY